MMMTMMMILMKKKEEEKIGRERIRGCRGRKQEGKAEQGSQTIMDKLVKQR